MGKKRLIDKDGVLEEFKDRLNKEGDTTAEIINICMGVASGIIEKFPEEDAEIVRHGKAVKVFDAGKATTACSECGGKIAAKDKRCKHCGAKLDKQ